MNNLWLSIDSEKRFSSLRKFQIIGEALAGAYPVSLLYAAFLTACFGAIGSAAWAASGMQDREVMLAARGDAPSTATSVAGAEKAGKPDDRESPWLIMPTLSASPKLGTSLGVMAAYLHYFDEESQVSMFGAAAQYTSTHSAVGALIANASFGEDHHRLIGLVASGVIKNDYNDYLGTGQPLKTEDNLRAAVSRYLYRVYDNWFVGGQAVFTNYQVVGETLLDQETLNVLGVKGFRAGGIGAAAYHDSRDNVNNPNKGWLMNFNNVAYRDWLGGNGNYDVYRLDLRGFWEHGGGNVLAARQSNQWTFDAPLSANAPVVLRGYKMGQYLGKYMSSLEAEERFRLGKSWGATLFYGMACLYGNGDDCSDSKNRYPSWGAGIQYILKQKEGIVANLEYAEGKWDNYGIYLKMGYAY
jgi:hypothetical protein